MELAFLFVWEDKVESLVVAVLLEGWEWIRFPNHHDVQNVLLDLNK